MINTVTLVGRLTKDPNIRKTPNGISVAQFTLAINRNFTNQNGEREADFIEIVAFRKQAENIGNYLFKGSLAGVTGRIQSRSYENPEGQRVYVKEVVADSVQFLEPKGTNSQGNNAYTNQRQQTSNYQPPQNNNYQGQNNNYQPPKNNYQPPRQTNQFANANGPIDISDDDLPF
ncbi:single-stranded DNA-binding protein [Staphylococcus xylosus]